MFFVFNPYKEILNQILNHYIKCHINPKSNNIWDEGFITSFQKKKMRILIIFLLFNVSLLSGQSTFKATLADSDNNNPLEYVNIGIVSKKCRNGFR